MPSGAARPAPTAASVARATTPAAYRPATDASSPTVDVWFESLAVGTPLPNMPLAVIEAIVGGKDIQLMIGISYRPHLPEEMLLRLLTRRLRA